MADVDNTGKNAPLYQKLGNKLTKVYLETSASQVKMKAEGGGDSNAQVEIELLRQKLKEMGTVVSHGFIYKGVVNASTPLPQQDYKSGWVYKVGEAGTYAGQKCEVGDTIYCLNDYVDSFKDEDWSVVQANIDGAVTGPEASTADNLAAFDGATGKVIKDSGVSLTGVTDAITKAHEHANKDTVLDKLGVGEEGDLAGQLTFDGKQVGDTKVDIVSTTDINTVPANLRDGGFLIVITGVAPTLASSTPAASATDVAVDSNIVLTFSKAVKVGTGNITLTPADGTPVTIAVTDGQVSISGTTVTIDPTNSLENGKVYTVNVAEGAILANDDGTAFAGGDILSFTTVAA